MLMALAFLVLGSALAQDDDEVQVDPLTGLPVIYGLDDEDDVDIELPAPPAPVKVGPPALGLDPAAAEPLTAVFPAKVTAVAPGLVVVELPVYVAKAPRSPEPGLMIIGEFMVGAAKVAEVQQVFEPAYIRADGPTWALLRAAVPTATPTGTVTVVVKTAAKDGKTPKEAFRSTVDWAP